MTDQLISQLPLSRRAISAVSKVFIGDRPLTGTGFLAAVIFGWFIELMYGFSVADGSPWLALRTFCLLWFASAAAFFVGTIAGFLFGVPKVFAGPTDSASAAGPAQKADRYRINTNLEDISDWFTKIILGLGLVHIRTVVSFIGDVGASTGDAMGPLQGAKAIAIAAMIYGFVCGFLITYIWTRINLRTEFEKVETN